eukprot:2657639-Lingulodinium_polyedra.AAC.1
MRCWPSSSISSKVAGPGERAPGDLGGDRGRRPAPHGLHERGRHRGWATSRLRPPARGHELAAGGGRRALRRLPRRSRRGAR